MAAMSAVEVRDRLADRFRLLQRATAGPERQLTLRHAVEWSYDLLTDDEQALLRRALGVRRRFRPGKRRPVVAARDDVEVLRHLDSLVRKSLVVADHTGGPHPLPAVRDDPTVRARTAWPNAARSRSPAIAMRHTSRGSGRALGELGRARVARAPSTGSTSSWATFGRPTSGAQQRGDVAVATDIAAHAALMGFSVQLFETLAWAEELLPAATVADVRRLPRLYTAAGYACFAGRPEAARGERAPRDGAGDGTALRPVRARVRRRSSRRWARVYCGDLDRYVELTGEVARELRARARVCHRRLRRRACSRAGRVEEALTLTEESVAVARDARQPVLDRVRALDRRHGVLEGRRRGARSRPGTRASPSSVSTACSSSRDSSRATRRVSTRPTVRPRPRSSCSPRPSPRSSVRATCRSWPSPWRACPRCSSDSTASHPRRCSSARCSPRVGRTTCPGWPSSRDRVAATLGPTRAAELTAAGAALDLNGAAVYARQQIDVARREPTPRPREERPGGLSRREVEVLRLVSDGRSVGRDRVAAVHLDPHRRAPRPEHLHEDRRLQPRRGDSLGRRPRRRRRASAFPERASTLRKWVALPMS